MSPQFVTTTSSGVLLRISIGDRLKAISSQESRIGHKETTAKGVAGFLLHR